MDQRFEGWSGRCGARGCALLLATIAALSACGGQTGRDSSSSKSATSFSCPRNYATVGLARSIAIGDLNGDGKQDLATASGATSVAVLLNKGDPGFQAKRDYATGGRATSVAIGDLNGDGKPELVAASGDSGDNGLERPSLCS